MKNLYLILAVIGTVIPFWFFIQFFGSQGLSLPGFVSGLFANGAAGGFSADVLISSLVFWVYMLVERKRNEGPKPYLFIALNLNVGLSAALPAYLYTRED
ncbi:MAG: DUF2834 domain-containing protein [Chloroflexi bacterium]|nr:DUF2834 domain-containing protein [Chloroflexota bacterium]MQC27122.1 DUF2834 domain-containing protein [Chloroflexota bacterium]